MMMEYLESVKPNSLIIIAVKGRTSEEAGIWNCTTVKYMDSFGSKTYNGTTSDKYNTLSQCTLIDLNKGSSLQVSQAKKKTFLTAEY